MIQMHLQQNDLNWKLLDTANFCQLHNVIDNTMKERHAMGLGVKKSSGVISLGQEKELFAKGLLGVECPETLLRTVIIC